MYAFLRRNRYNEVIFRICSDDMPPIRHKGGPLAGIRHEGRKLSGIGFGCKLEIVKKDGSTDEIV